MSVETGGRRSCPFGIEVSKKLTWEAWEPGGEYTQQIKLKNVNVKTKKLKYKLPSSRFFTTQYPQPIVLSSGTSTCLPITFRPVEKGKYEDFIEFLTKDGKFRVPLTAIVPDAKLKLPSSLNFGMCAVQDRIEMNFEIVNTSDVYTAFQLQAAKPFTLKPKGGTLAPRTQCSITAVFQPMEALVYEQDAICHLGEKEGHTNLNTMKLEGIGKHPYLSIKNGDGKIGKCTLLDFGTIGLGGCAEKSIEICNNTPVKAPFQIVQSSSGSSLDNVFSCSHYHGVVLANSSKKVKFTFRSENTGMTYVENFEVIAIGVTSKSLIKCKGFATGPSVVIDSSCLQFGLTSPSKLITRSFKIRNTSSIPAVFQFQIDPHSSVFQLNTICGTLEPNSYQTIIVNFIPMKPISYYRKVVCLVHNQEPLELEMIGTCHSKEVQPVVLSRKHLESSNRKLEAGLSWYPPEHLEELMKHEKISVAEDGSFTVIDEETKNNLEMPCQMVQGFAGYFLDNGDGDMSSHVPHISLDVHNIDFGRCPHTAIYQKTLNVTNHTHGKVTCNWMNTTKGVFSVTPDVLDIEPQSTISFQVVFKPMKPSHFFTSELEGYICYKSMRDHRLLDERTLALPWCVTATVSGHTFAKSSETYLPVCSWDSLNMVFPPQTISDESLYRTCLLTNNGDTPIHFKFDEDESRVFSCKPQMGLLSGKYQIFIFRMLPWEVGTTKRNIKCCLNNTDKYTEEIKAVTSCEVAEVVLQPTDAIYFKPTCINATSRQTSTLKNISRIPLRFEWKIPREDVGTFQVSPISGIILPNEIQNHEWSFVPSGEGKHITKVKVAVYNEEDSSNKNQIQKYFVQLIGEGQSGKISCEDPEISFGSLVVGTTKRQSLKLYNESSCDLVFELFSHQACVSPGAETSAIEPILKFDHTKSKILARSSTTVEFSITPKRRGFYECSVSYMLQPSLKELPQKDCKETGKHQQHLCTLSVKGVYPDLKIVDVLGSGCVNHYSKKLLWKLLAVDQWNSLLVGDPSPDELKYAINTRHSTRRRMPKTTDARCDVDFGSASQGSEACKVTMVLENKGNSTVEWAFKLPTDLQLEVEYWADNGMLEEDELHEMHIMEKRLFEIEPKSGRIQRGQMQTVTFIYRHDFTGLHKLPVLFKIVQGREILLNFIGTTTEQSAHSLHFNSTQHEFSPVAIGYKMAPIQSYELCNGSNSPIEFSMDLSVLDEIQQNNYNWRVFDCVNPSGTVPPGECALVQWIFAPLEAKHYSIDVPVTVKGGSTTKVTFTGVGYQDNECHKAIKDDSSPGVNKHSFRSENQLVHLSKDHLSFGTIPLFTESSLLLFIENISPINIASYKWRLKNTPAEGIVNITPSQGFLKPKESVLSKVTIFSEGPPAIHDLDIILEALDETMMAVYNRDLESWQRKKEEHKHMFIIKESPSKRKKSKQNMTSSTTPARPNSEFTKYEALPPIRTPDKEPQVLEEQIQFTDQRPSPPQSSLTHLGVTVTTIPIQKFVQMGKSCTEKHFIKRDPLLHKNKEKPDVLGQPETEEINACNEIIASLLRDMLDEEDVIHSMLDTSAEEIPYFAMLNHEKGEEEEYDGRSDESRPQSSRSSHVYGWEDTSTPMQEESTEIFTGEEIFQTSVSLTEEAPKEANDVPSGNVENVSSNSAFYEVRQYLKGNAEARYLMHDVIENTLFNLMNEASMEEICLTARPRLIALPPSAKKNK